MNDDAGREDLPAEMNKTNPAFPMELMKQFRKMPDMEVVNKPE